MPEIARKLQLKPPRKGVVLAAPPSLSKTLAAEGFAASSGPADVVLAFAADRKALEKIAPVAIKAVAPGGILWLSYPKKTGAIASDLSREVVWEVSSAHGWEPVSQVALDETWSAMRVKNDPALGAERKGRAAARPKRPKTSRPDLERE